MSALGWGLIILAVILIYNHVIVHNPEDPFNQEDHAFKKEEWNRKSHNKVYDANEEER